MTPTREQFKDFIASIKKAQEKEDNLGKAFELIWDDDQGQYLPFYILPLWGAVYQAFNIMFNLKDDDVIGNHKRGTGVYVRENGQTVELKTMEEVRSDVQKLKSAGFDKKTSFRKIK